MSKDEEFKREIARIIEGLKSNTINLDKASRILNHANRLIQYDKLALEEHEIRKEEPPDYLFTEQQIEEIESMITLAKKEMEKLKKA